MLICLNLAPVKEASVKVNLFLVTSIRMILLAFHVYKIHVFLVDS